jgi:ABC-type Mn2+/Zn2+ transport system permease subunit
MLFGNILGITPADIFLSAALTFVVVVFLFVFHKEFELFSVDPAYAQLIGIRPALIRYVLLILLSLTVVTGIQAVGTVLTNALLIAPVAAARLLTNRLKIMMLLSALMSISAGWIGVYASYYLGLSSGAAIVVVCCLWFAVAWGIKSLRRKA